MSLRVGILATMAVLGLALLGVWLFAPAALIELQRLLDRDTIKALVERAGLWGPFLIVGLITIAVVASPVPSAPIARASSGGRDIARIKVAAPTTPDVALPSRTAA